MRMATIIIHDNWILNASINEDCIQTLIATTQLAKKSALILDEGDTISIELQREYQRVGGMVAYSRKQSKREKKAGE